MAFDLNTLGDPTMLAKFIFGFLLVFLVLGVILYVYLGLAFMAIARRAKQNMPGLAWIPGVGPLIIAYRSSGMHWWPWLLIIGFFIPILNFLAYLAFMVFAIIWMWKLFEAVKRPGWWAILPIIPVVGGIIGLILVGIAAWGKQN